MNASSKNHPPVGTSTDPAVEAARKSDTGHDPETRRATEQAQAALDNVREGYEKAPPGAAGEPSWPTGGNLSHGPKDKKDVG